MLQGAGDWESLGFCLAEMARNVTRSRVSGLSMQKSTTAGWQWWPLLEWCFKIASLAAHFPKCGACHSLHSKMSLACNLPSVFGTRWGFVMMAMSLTSGAGGVWRSSTEGSACWHALDTLCQSTSNGQDIFR